MNTNHTSSLRSRSHRGFIGVHAVAAAFAFPVLVATASLCPESDTPECESATEVIELTAGADAEISGNHFYHAALRQAGDVLASDGQQEVVLRVATDPDFAQVDTTWRTANEQAVAIGDDGLWRVMVSENAQTPPVMLGVVMTEPSEALAVHLGFDAETATMVSTVYEGLPAWEAGLRPYDIIVGIGGKRGGASTKAIREVLAAQDEGDVLSMRVIQKGKERTLNVTLKKYNDALLSEARPHGNVGGLSVEQNFFAVPDSQDASQNIWLDVQGDSPHGLNLNELRDLEIGSEIAKLRGDLGNIQLFMDRNDDRGHGGHLRFNGGDVDLESLIEGITKSVEIAVEENRVEDVMNAIRFAIPHIAAEIEVELEDELGEESGVRRMLDKLSDKRSHSFSFEMSPDLSFSFSGDDPGELMDSIVERFGAAIEAEEVEPELAKRLERHLGTLLEARPQMQRMGGGDSQIHRGRLLLPQAVEQGMASDLEARLDRVERMLEQVLENLDRRER